MDDPYSPDIELRQCMAMCSVETLPRGHRAVFNGVAGSFCESNGPNEWTEEMARKLAVFFWCLRQREGDLSS